tara:strand:- start:630 stop:1079 length:450 start_codon:yes stop_codon:yes gene_type:complete
MKHGNLEPEENVMKPTENYEQLLQRFTKRVVQLEEEQEEVRLSHEKWVKLNTDLERLEGSIQAVEYLAFGKLPHDGNHGGMKDHKPMPVVITGEVPGVDVSDFAPGVLPENISIDTTEGTVTVGEGSVISSGIGTDDIIVNTGDGTITL